jgi:hypothetical protein
MLTRGDAIKDSNQHAVFQDSEDSNYEKQTWYLIFALFWNTQFIVACGQIIVAGMIATWYFTRNKSDLDHVMIGSVGRLLRYHLGSAAFGSLIIAIIQFIRAVLHYIKEKTDGKAGAIAKIVIKCCMCCFWCLEKFMQFINKNAYIEIAIYGYGFCGAAMRAFKLLASNLLRVITLNTVTLVILFVCKLFVIAITGIFAYYLIQNDKELKEDLHYRGIIVFFACVIAYFIADLFMNIYDMTIDTIFLCFAEDSERNNGKDKPYFMSSNLLKFMNKHATNKPVEGKAGDE